MATRDKINRGNYKDPQLAQVAKDTDRALDTMPIAKTVGAIQYTEPFYVALPRKPSIFALVRVQQDGAPNTSVTWGAMTWEWDGKHAKVIDIISMATGATKYHFTFLVME